MSVSRASKLVAAVQGSTPAEVPHALKSSAGHLIPGSSRQIATHGIHDVAPLLVECSAFAARGRESLAPYAGSNG